MFFQELLHTSFSQRERERREKREREIGFFKRERAIGKETERLEKKLEDTKKLGLSHTF